MNISLPFGIRITNDKTATADLDFDLDDDLTQLGESRKLARRVIRGIGQRQMDTQARIQHIADRVTKLILLISIPHQMGYIWELNPTELSFATPLDAVHSLSAIFASLGMPFVCDILTYLAVLLAASLPIARWYARLIAFAFMLATVAGSSYVNFHAPGTMELRKMFSVLVFGILIAQGLKALSEAINWAKLRKMEERAAEEVGVSTTIALPVVKAAGKTCPAGCTCLKHPQNKPATTKPAAKNTTPAKRAPRKPAAAKPAKKGA